MRKPALGAQSGAVADEEQRDGDHEDGEEAEQCRRPARVELVVHLRREQWEGCTE